MTNQNRIELKLVKNSTGTTYQAKVFIDGKVEQIIESQNRSTVARVVTQEYPGLPRVLKK